MMRLIICLFLLCAVFTYSHAISQIHPSAKLASSPYPDWAHDHWVWLDGPRANQSSVLSYVQSYFDHNIYVGGYDVDSTWEQGFNDFIMNTNKYPNVTDMIDTLHAKGVKVIFWITSMIDTNSPNYNQTYANNYFIQNALGEQAVFKWWHGHGSLIDYTNPAAKSYWHSLLDQVLALGIDGWKTDGTDPYIMEAISPRGFNGSISYREYADMYYGDFYDYTRQMNGDNCLIMSRPVDGLDNAIYIDFSPRRVMTAGWVGDQDPTWFGLEQALIRIILSGQHNYANFGSDTGGYRKGQRSPSLLIRWSQMNAFLPLFENGGNNDHIPWAYDTNNSTTITDIYRSYVQFHQSLKSYFLTIGSAALENNQSSIFPICTTYPITTYDYLLGSDMFVSPIVTNTTDTFTINFPNIAGTSWTSFTAPDNMTYTAGQSATLSFDLTILPVYSRVGSIIPLQITTNDIATLPFGDISSDDALTLYIHSPLHKSQVQAIQAISSNTPMNASMLLSNALPNEGTVYTHIRQFHNEGIIAGYHNDGDMITVAVTATTTPIIILIKNIKCSTQAIISQDTIQGSIINDMILPSTDSTSELRMKGTGYYYDVQTQRLFIRPSDVEVGSTVYIKDCTV